MAYTVFSIAYGYRPQSDNDELLLMIKKMMEDFSVFATPGNFLVDIFPTRESPRRSPRVYSDVHHSEVRSGVVPRCQLQEIRVSCGAAHQRGLPAPIRQG